MNKLACLLVLLSLGLFAVGCGGKDEKKDGDKESGKNKDEAGQGVKVDKGGTQEITDPSSILGGEDENTAESGEKKDPVETGDKEDSADSDQKTDPTKGDDTKDAAKDGEDTGLKLQDPVIAPPKVDLPGSEKDKKEDAAEKSDESKEG